MRAGLCFIPRVPAPPRAEHALTLNYHLPLAVPHARARRKKALRTVRRGKIEAGWVAEAEKKRQEALQQCMEAKPVPILSSTPAADETAVGQQRGRDGAAMAVDKPAAAKKQGKGKQSKGIKVGGGVSKKRKPSKARMKVEAAFGAKKKRVRRS